MNPFASLLRSRKFWLMILDIVVSGCTYFIPKYAGVAFAEDALWVVAAIQPVFVTVIGAVAYEDGQRLQAGVHVDQAK